MEKNTDINMLNESNNPPNDPTAIINNNPPVNPPSKKMEIDTYIQNVDKAKEEKKKDKYYSKYGKVFNEYFSRIDRPIPLADKKIEVDIKNDFKIYTNFHDDDKIIINSLFLKYLLSKNFLDINEAGPNVFTSNIKDYAKLRQSMNITKMKVSTPISYANYDNYLNLKLIYENNDYAVIPTSLEKLNNKQPGAKYMVETKDKLFSTFIFENEVIHVYNLDDFIVITKSYYKADTYNFIIKYGSVKKPLSLYSDLFTIDVDEDYEVSSSIFFDGINKMNPSDLEYNPNLNKLKFNINYSIEIAFSDMINNQVFLPCIYKYVDKFSKYRFINLKSTNFKPIKELFTNGMKEDIKNIKLTFKTFFFLLKTFLKCFENKNISKKDNLQVYDYYFSENVNPDIIKGIEKIQNKSAELIKPIPVSLLSSVNLKNFKELSNAATAFCLKAYEYGGQYNMTKLINENQTHVNLIFENVLKDKTSFWGSKYKKALIENFNEVKKNISTITQKLLDQRNKLNISTTSNSYLNIKKDESINFIDNELITYDDISNFFNPDLYSTYEIINFDDSKTKLIIYVSKDDTQYMSDRGKIKLQYDIKNIILKILLGEIFDANVDEETFKLSDIEKYATRSKYTVVKNRNTELDLSAINYNEITNYISPFSVNDTIEAIKNDFNFDLWEHIQKNNLKVEENKKQAENQSNTESVSSDAKTYFTVVKENNPLITDEKTKKKINAKKKKEKNIIKLNFNKTNEDKKKEKEKVQSKKKAES